MKNSYHHGVHDNGGKAFVEFIGMFTKLSHYEQL
jgi:hypothetical protein